MSSGSKNKLRDFSSVMPDKLDTSPVSSGSLNKLSFVSLAMPEKLGTSPASPGNVYNWSVVNYFALPAARLRNAFAAAALASGLPLLRSLTRGSMLHAFSISV